MAQTVTVTTTFSHNTPNSVLLYARGENGGWCSRIKLGWVYNTAYSEPQQALVDEPRYNSQFPEIVRRGAEVIEMSP